MHTEPLTLYREASKGDSVFKDMTRHVTGPVREVERVINILVGRRFRRVKEGSVRRATRYVDTVVPSECTDVTYHINWQWNVTGTCTLRSLGILGRNSTVFISGRQICHMVGHVAASEDRNMDMTRK